MEVHVEAYVIGFVRLAPLVSVVARSRDAAAAKSVQVYCSKFYLSQEAIYVVKGR